MHKCQTVPDKKEMVTVTLGIFSNSPVLTFVLGAQKMSLKSVGACNSI